MFGKLSAGCSRSLIVGFDAVTGAGGSVRPRPRLIWFLAVCCRLLCVFPLAANTEEGLASFYAGKFQGRMTANGEFFDTREYTAAHKTLPFNTIVRVTNLETGLHTLVRINDRGPFVEGRVIDLSRSAAAAIGMVAAGVARVTVEVVHEGDGATYHRDGYREELYSVQVASFGDPANAERLYANLDNAGFDPVLEPVGEQYTRVIIPAVPREDLLLVRARLGALGYTGVIVRGGPG